jgi:hypothetical protein
MQVIFKKLYGIFLVNLNYELTDEFEKTTLVLTCKTTLLELLHKVELNLDIPGFTT